MKKLLLLLCGCLSAFAVGTVTQSVSPIGPAPATGPDLRTYSLQITWVGDAANGSVPSTVLNSIVQNTAMQGMRISSVEIQPGTPNPTALYSITLTDATGADLLAGTGANLSATAASFSSSVVSPPLLGLPTFNLSGNSVNSAQGKITIYFVPLSVAASARGLPANLGTNNNYTGTNTFTSLVTAGSFNNIRIVDGFKFPQSAAGINAADADLGTGVGEIWIPPTPFAGITATDAQISISKNHTLRVMGRISVDSVNKGPILFATGSKLICNGNDSSQITNVGVGTFTSMLRLAVQDGSVTDGLFIEGCLISGGINPASLGIIDASGSANLAHIRDSYLFGFTSGWGIFVQDIQSGALAGTTNLIIQGNNITATGTGGCVEVTHGATNAVVINNISIIDTTCIPGSSFASTGPLTFTNTAASTKLQQINLLNVNIFAIPASQEGILVNGVFQLSAKHIFCGGGTSCFYINNNTNNLAVSADNVACSGCTNSLQDIANNYVNSNNYINHYGFTASSAGFSGNNILSGTTQTGNFNNIRIVDGVKFAQSAAGINAADADLGATIGEVWLPPGSIAATDAQISIRINHTLRVFGQLTINAQTQGPILLGSGTRLSCSAAYPGTGIFNNGTGITSMVRLAAQDGSQAVGVYIDGCHFNAGATTVSNGVIDASGSVNQGFIRDNFIENFTSGWGIFIQDIQSGALGGTTNLQIVNNRILGTNTGGCIDIAHGATNNVLLFIFDIQETFCTTGSSITTAPIQVTNTSAGTNIRQVNITHVFIQSIPGGQPGITLNGVFQGAVKHVSCYSSGSGSAGCVNIPSNAQTSGITIENVFAFPASNPITVVDSNSSISTTGGVLGHYDNSADFLTSVAYLKVAGVSPSVAGTGFGVGPTINLNAGSTNNAGIVQVTTGTTPATSGTITLTFNTTQSAFGVNFPMCVVTLSGAATWNPRATVILNSTTTSAATWNWDNNGVTLAASTSPFNFHYWCSAR